MTQKFSTHGYTFLNVGDAGKVDGSCFNCGLGIRYYAVYQNNETGSIVRIGQTCMSNATPEQKRAFSVVERRARLARKVAKFIATDETAQRLAAYCEANPISEDKDTDNWMLHLKLSHLQDMGYFNDREYDLIETLLRKEGSLTFSQGGN
jgi:hypothetical protein